MKLFKCKTIAQCKIGMYLEEQGITREDITSMEMISDASLKITNAAGQYLVLEYIDGKVHINTDPE